MWYPPNADGIDWFLEFVWPAIRARRRNANLLIAGAASPELRSRWSRREAVHAPGFVDDLGACYKEAAIVICPIRIGGGSNIKVLEALAWGKALVATSFSFGGFADILRPEVDLCVADSADGFAAACLRLMNDTAMRATIAASGHARVRAEYTEDKFRSIVAEAVTRAVKEGGRAPDAAHRS
jgi:glycosyltransferase involved in cell wall biosynthesis